MTLQTISLEPEESSRKSTEQAAQVSFSGGKSYKFNTADTVSHERHGSTRVQGSRPVTDKTVIEYRGLPMTAAQAVEHGAPLTRGDDGIYRERGADPEAQAGGQPPTPNDTSAEPAPAPLKPEVFTAHDALVKALPEPVLDAAVARIIEAGSVEGANMGDVEGSGMKRDEFTAHAQTVVDGLQAQAEARIEAQGAEPQAFYAWARKADPEGLRRAMTEHYHNADPKVYAALVDKYFRSVPPSIEALNASGYEAWTDRATGEAMVRIKGQVTKVKAAAKAGLF